MNNASLDASVTSKLTQSLPELGVEPGSCGVIALSGGPDSVALVRLLSELRVDYRFKLVLAHLDHGLRPESVRDALFCERLAQSLNLPIVTGCGLVKRAKIQKKLGTEAAARQVRYDFLERVRRQCSAEWIAVAHTQDDHLETFFLHLLRGSGLRGLSGLSVKRGRVVRPLLRCSKAELYQYLAQKKVNYCTDESNADTGYLRNALRHELFPVLTRLSPGWPGNLLRSARQLREVENYLNIQGEVALRQIEFEQAHFSQLSWQNLPGVLQIRTLQLMVLSLRGDLRGWYERHWQVLSEFLRTKQSGECRQLPAGLSLRVNRGTVDWLDLKSRKESG